MTNDSFRNYGTNDCLWELWHKGPVFDRENVVLIHGFRFPLAPKKGECNRQFADLDDFLQSKDSRFNVWQFEYASSLWGTPNDIATYAARLGEAVDRICEITGNRACSIVAYSMGGIIARQHIMSGGRSRVDKLLTLATPHLGTLRFEPFNLRWATNIFPRAAVELRPDSRLLWDLNTNVEASTAPEFAAIGGYSWGHTDGLIEMGSSSLIESKHDGSIARIHYFAGVNRSHISINRIRDEDDEVYQLVRSFLLGGVAGINNMRPAEIPGDYNVSPFLTFSLKDRPGWRLIYPYVDVANTGRRYRGIKVFSQGASTADGSYIFTVKLRPDDEGKALIHYARGRYAEVNIQRGQSTIVAEPIGRGIAARDTFSMATA
jgi:pimeloyl-ACP methyl ester carboxylesterase